MTEIPEPSPDLRWATHTEPDFLALQLPPVPVVTATGAHDAMRALLAQRGFRPVAPPGSPAGPAADPLAGELADELDLGAANGCALTRTGPTSAELLLTIGGRVGASRVPLTGVDEAWLARAVRDGHAAVLAVESAVGPDGSTSREAVRRDVEAGGVVAALVPVDER